MSIELETSVTTVAPPVPVQQASAFASWLERFRERKLAASGLDLRWARFLITFLILGISLAFVPNPTVAESGEIVTIVAGVLMCVYFAHMLLFRLQLSLLEACVLIALIGNFEGLLLTMPGIRSVGFFWMGLMIPMIAAWVLYGAVKGIIQAELLQVSSPLKRAWFIISGVITIAAPALILCGGAFWLAREQSMLISANMRAWSVPLIVFGCIGLALRVRMGLLARRAARAALARPVNATSSGT